MSETIQNALRVSDHYRSYANLVGGLSLVVFSLLFLPDLSNAVKTRINLPQAGGYLDLIAFPIFAVCLFIVVGSLVRLSSYLVEEILGRIFPSFGYSYYYKMSKGWIEKEYANIFDDIDHIKATKIFGTVDLLNTLKFFIVITTPSNIKLFSSMFLRWKCFEIFLVLLFFFSSIKLLLS